LSLYDDSRAAPGDRLPEATVRALAEKSRHAHVSITYPCAFTLPLLREAGLTLSTDLHNWDGVNPYHEPFAFEADLVFLSATALEDTEATLRRIAEHGKARVVVATDGAAGAHLLVDGELTHVPAIAPPEPVVDSNGAGDAFAAGFLLGWLAGEDPARCALFGAVAGAYACTVEATRADAIGREPLLARVAEWETGTGRRAGSTAETAGAADTTGTAATRV
ncbi:PfkB family carbohydrate kinase, partial [Streptomyces sp. NPDC002690]